jgi:hypothetical protein
MIPSAANPTAKANHPFLSNWLKRATSQSTYLNATFASLGITPSTYVWTWGTARDQSFTINAIARKSLRAALPLFAASLGGLGLLGWRRKRKTQALA